MSEETKTIVPLNVEPPTKPEPKSAEMSQVEAKSISKFAEASMIEYTEREKSILFAPIDVNDIKIRPDGQIYLEWAFYAERLDAAFGQGQWALSPAPWSPRLYREGNITYREYVLWIKGNFAANAIGHHEEQRRTANFGDAAESTYANALTRCCKRIGMARDLWKKDKIEQFKVLLKKNSRSNHQTPTISPEGATTSPPVMPTVVDSGRPHDIDHFIFSKDQLMNAGTIEELKSVWGFAMKFRHEMTPAQFTALEVLKNERKNEMTQEANI
jgi:hypothetical protein